MRPWTFLDYWPVERYNPVRAWTTRMGDQNPRIPIELDAVIDALRQTPDWRNPPIPRLYRDLEDDLAGLGEIVFEFEEEQRGERPKRRRFRAFVQLREEQHVCVLLVCCEHWPRHRLYEPADAPALARKYADALAGDVGFTDRHF